MSLLSDLVEDRFAIVNLVFNTVTCISILAGLVGYFIAKSLDAQEAIGRVFCHESMGYFKVQKPRWPFGRNWDRRRPIVPTIRSLIQLGDELVYTSAIFDDIFETHDICWMGIYSKIWEEVARKREWADFLVERRCKDLQRSISRARKVSEYAWPVVLVLFEVRNWFLVWERGKPNDKDHCPQVASTTPRPKPTRRQLYADMKLISCIREMPTYHDPQPNGGKGNSGPDAITTAEDENTIASKIEADLSDSVLFCREFTRPRLSKGRPYIETTQEEIAALALILGINFRMAPDSIVSGTGAFGTSLFARPIDLSWKIALHHGHRRFRHTPSMGNGYTTLYAKYIACGGLPFCQTRSVVKYVFVTDDVLRAIRKGRNIYDCSNPDDGQSGEYLVRLPGARGFDLYGGTMPERTDTIGIIYQRDQRTEIGKWPFMVAAIAFGGLVPQAAPNVVDAVKFTVSGQVDQKRLVKELDKLIDEVDRRSPDLNLFGEYVTRRANRSSGEVSGYTSIEPSRLGTERTRDSGAMFARYTTLLERVLAMSVYKRESESSCILGMECAYHDSCEYLKRVYKEAVEEVGDEVSLDLADAVRKIRGNLEGLPDHHQTPILPDAWRELVRCVLAAWAYEVPLISLAVDGPSEADVLVVDTKLSDPTTALSNGLIVRKFGAMDSYNEEGSVANSIHSVTNVEVTGLVEVADFHAEPDGRRQPRKKKLGLQQRHVIDGLPLSKLPQRLLLGT